MKLPLLALALASLAIPGAALAHDAVPVVAAGNTLLTLSAEGKAVGKPDLAVFSAGVTSSGKTASEALAANSAAMTRAMAALKKAGIADRDIQTSDLSLYPVYANVPQQPGDMLEQQVPPIIGYRVNNTINVRQRKLDQYGVVIDTLVRAGANQVNGPSFQIEDNSAALDLARANAMQSARKRADLYAKAAGLRVLRIVSISEGGGYAPPMPVMYARAAMADSAGAPPPVSAGEVQSNMNVTVLFELAP
jgi:uncharacterized protein